MSEQPTTEEQPIIQTVDQAAAERIAAWWTRYREIRKHHEAEKLAIAKAKALK